MYVDTPWLILTRHAEDTADCAWLQAKNDPQMLGIPGRGPEKHIPAIRAALQEYDNLARAIWDNSIISSALCQNPPHTFCSRKTRAIDSVHAFHEHLKAYHRTLKLQGISFEEALNGRNYGFPWHRTEAGLKKLLSREDYEHLERDFFTYQAPGGESWVDVIARVKAFIQGRVIPTPRNLILMTHHELVPIIEDLLLGKEPDRSIIDRMPELPNATARIWNRGPRGWTYFKTISGRMPERDYSDEPDAIAWRTPPGSTGVVELDAVRRKRSA